MIFNSIHQNILEWEKDLSAPLYIHGVNNETWLYIKQKLLANDKTRLAKSVNIYVFPTIEEAEDFFDTIKKMNFGCKSILVPGNDLNPYSGYMVGHENLIRRFSALENITHDDEIKIVVTTVEAMQLRLPPKNFFSEFSLNLEVSDICGPLELASKLVDLGYVSSTTVEEPGTFCQKGEIFDIYPMAHSPIRLHYFDDMIEEIWGIDLSTQKTNRKMSYQSLRLGPAPLIFCKGEFPNKLRNQIPMPETRYKERFEARKKIFHQLSNGQVFEGIPFYIPLFFDESCSLVDYFNQDNLDILYMGWVECERQFSDYEEELREDFERLRDDPDCDNLLPEPKILYDLELTTRLGKLPNIKINEIALVEDLHLNEGNTLNLTVENSKTFLNRQLNQALPKPEYLKQALLLLKREFASEGQIFFAHATENSKNEIQHLLTLLEFSSSFLSRVHFEKLPLKTGFYYPNEKILVLTEGDLFSFKKAKASQKKVRQDLDLFAEQISTLKEGDFVIHVDHGVGKYKGLESLDIGGPAADYLVIEYQDSDKVYVPIYKMNLIQKHADSQNQIKPASLRSNKFTLAKEKARKSAKKLAFDLLELHAKRESAEAFSFSPPCSEYREFELDFPFQETPDQTAAIESVMVEMEKNRPMDYLVCGDVGFGKTEVAMRAAFRAVLDHKQVAVLVPTTILALQHYNSFKKRFKNFPIQINFLSRLKGTKETNEIRDKLESGNLDILIGTHKLLSEKNKYKDLGLVVVDEEQRFGVNHKEKLKALKNNVDVLTLTATPIPRTLQLAFLGLRDLSLIKTAPPRRQSIKTYLIKEDDATIQSAIQKELSRGGQVFIVHNRVQDIEQYSAHIRDLVPDATIVIGHGQLPPNELEKRMQAFYEGKFQILIATTIIESGLDIPNANTMIVDRADRYGLAQLHQLRGRIGRSDRKAYAYFVIPKNRKLTEIAEQRLKSLQTYAEMGSGFNIASCDLEIRGAGDILGAEQSGHIDSVGLELYMELLKEAINELKGVDKLTKIDMEISTPFAVNIPAAYIKDSRERLKQYKTLSNCSDESRLDEIRETLFDVYGAPPKEVENLINLLKCRVVLGPVGIKSMKLLNNMVQFNFDKPTLDGHPEIRNKVVETFIAKPKTYQFTPDFKVIANLKENLDMAGLLEFSKKIAEQIIP